MNEKEVMVSVPLSRYEELVSLETRVKILEETVKKEKYSVDREKISMILDFELPANTVADGIF